MRVGSGGCDHEIDDYELLPRGQAELQRHTALSRFTGPQEIVSDEELIQEAAEDLLAACYAVLRSRETILAQCPDDAVREALRQVRAAVGKASGEGDE